VSDSSDAPILAIETSCDETAAAVCCGSHILSNIVLSQIPLHKPFWGTVPEVAARAHLRWLLPVVERALKEANVSISDLTAVAATQKPGLIGALLVGLTAAKTLALCTKKPLIAVDHLLAHIYAAFMATNASPPCVALLVSGGHTCLYRVESVLDAVLLGKTIDDAAGEAFDKVARMLNLSYPGGPAIEKAAKGKRPAIRFPRSLLGENSLDFSFSGLKTAVLYYLKGQDGRGRSEPLDVDVGEIAASFQEAVVDVLVEKSLRALRATGIRRLIVVGGVAANSRLRQALASTAAERRFELFIPPHNLCTDNAAMVAGLAHHLLKAGRIAPLSIDAQPN